MRIESRFAFFLGLCLVLLGQIAHSRPHQVSEDTRAKCAHPRWVTVDVFTYGRESASVSDAAASSRAVYVVGRTSEPHWITRRSLDHGRSWTTVDLGMDAIAGAVAVDPLSGHVYVGGGARVSDGEESTHWMIRKSIDDGRTWFDVAASPISSGYIKRMAVDWRGVVYALGVKFVNELGFRPKLLRSTDGGRTWREIFFGAGFNPTAIAIDGRNRVFLSGEVFGGWGTRMSWDGVRDWRDVDFVPSSEVVVHSGSATRDGRVAFVGFASGLIDGHGLTRLSRTGLPGSWSSVDRSALPPAGVVFGKAGWLHTAAFGYDGFSGAPGLHAVTRTGRPVDPFRTTDYFLMAREVDSFHFDFPMAAAMGTPTGDAYTAITHKIGGRGQIGWRVRKLICR